MQLLQGIFTEIDILLDFSFLFNLKEICIKSNNKIYARKHNYIDFGKCIIDSLLPIICSEEMIGKKKLIITYNLE